MKHASTRELFNHWNLRRGMQSSPERDDIEPAAIRRALGDTFILAADRQSEPAFRLAGTRVCALFGRELRDHEFTMIWQPADRAAIREVLAEVADEMLGVVGGATARFADGTATQLEWIVLPLRHRGQMRVRMIGALGAFTLPVWLGLSKVECLNLGSLRHIDLAGESQWTPDLVSGSQPPRVRNGLKVYQGGRS